jgi:nucleoside-diphosphate-sugar epimerase
MASLGPSPFEPDVCCTGERVVVVGASGYIGRAVVREAAARGYHTTAVVRDALAYARVTSPVKGVHVLEADVCDRSSLERPGGPLSPGVADVVICCLASRQGTVRDAEAIDYQATSNCVRAALSNGCRHFVLLSAICVRSAETREPNALRFQVRTRCLSRPAPSPRTPPALAMRSRQPAEQLARPQICERQARVHASRRAYLA